MILQVFPVTRAFNRPPRCCRRVAPSQPVTRSWLEVEVHSSVSGKGLQYNDELLGHSSQTRTDMIAQLRRAVESGTYCVSAELIAEKMVQAALAELLT
jgi:anti-sigma28 factor (negative regulator of flagellin synthesis)